MSDHQTIFVSDERAPVIAATKASFAELWSKPWIAHADGRSFLMTATQPGYDRYVLHEVHGAASDHLDGDCFECSHVEPPPEWSQEERRARAEAAPPAGEGGGWPGKLGRLVAQGHTPQPNPGVRRGAKKAHEIARRDAAAKNGGR